MKHRIVIILLLFSVSLSGQVRPSEISGQVSFISSQNVYVRFGSTKGISVGDTLFINEDGKRVAVILITNLSSTSSVGNSIGNRLFSVGDPVLARIRPTEDDLKTETQVRINTEVPVSSQDTASDGTLPDKTRSQTIRGSISLNSYTDLSNTSADNTNRFRYTLSMNARNIGGSKLSADTYVSFKHKAGEWFEVRNDLFSALKIYSLSVNYDINEKTRLILGRNINQKISSVGAIDGLQAERSFKTLTLGAVAGFRPDYTDYSLDTKLFQYGAYVAHISKNEKMPFESSLGFMQQTNDFKTDRRFIYFQHSNNLIKNISLFSSFEVDLFRLNIDSLNNETKQSTFDLTSLYLSIRYKVFKNLSLYGSYDARKNVMYYETYKTFIDRILETELRQGFRLQVNYRITNSLNAGVESGYRFLKTDPHPSRNMYAFLTYNEIPGIKVTATISGTYLESAFMNGRIGGLDLTRSFAAGKLDLGLAYRYVDYRLPENILDITQHIGEANITWLIGRKISLSAYYEGEFEKVDVYNRFYLQLRKRF